MFVSLTREVLGDVAADDSGVVAAVFESMSHVGGLAASAYLTLLAVDAGFAVAQGVAAALVAVGAVTAAAVMPRSGAGGDPVEPGQEVSRLARRRSA